MGAEVRRIARDISTRGLIVICRVIILSTRHGLETLATPNG